MKIRKDDAVLVTKGKDRGKQGTVLRILSGQAKVVVENVNVVKRHLRARGMRPAEIVEKELPIPVANVMILCPHCGQPSRLRLKKLEDGTRARVCNCKEVIE